MRARIPIILAVLAAAGLTPAAASAASAAAAQQRRTARRQRFLAAGAGELRREPAGGHLGADGRRGGDLHRGRLPDRPGHRRPRRPAPSRCCSRRTRTAQRAPTRPRPGTTSSSAATSTSPPRYAAPARPAGRSPGSGSARGRTAPNWWTGRRIPSPVPTARSAWTAAPTSGWTSGSPRRPSGANSALKAITPFCTDSNFYDDLTADGGIPTPFVAGIGHGEPRGPQDNPATDPQSVTIAQQADGGPRSYDNGYWQSLDVQQLMVTDRGQRHPRPERGRLERPVPRRRPGRLRRRAERLLPPAADCPGHRGRAGHRPLPGDRRAVDARRERQRHRSGEHPPGMVRHLAQGRAHRHGRHRHAAAHLREHREPVGGHGRLAAVGSRVDLLPGRRRHAQRRSPALPAGRYAPRLGPGHRGATR